ncbi:MAG: radical SAM protein, partial [Candidatus Margulisbacteria bacterium]|nr:radical SAM protein [Candidatus Margulisiibacteriota bacterium]
MQDLKPKTLSELQDICEDLGFSRFKAKEIFKFIHSKFQTDFNELTTIKIEERELLKKLFTISNISLSKTEKSKSVEKALFELGDGKRIETVFMDYGGDERKTLCVSTQVGCPIKCEFCATGTMGFQRNLTTAEILSQVYYFAKENKISNIVFMGMGEPFLNYDNVIKAAYILNDECGLNIGARRTSISTIGIIAGINKLAQEGKQFRLAWSLVAPNDKLRRKLIPFKALSSISEIVA